MAARYPSLYEIPTRIWLGELGRDLARPATLDDVPDSVLRRIAARGFDWVWLTGVWQTGPAGQRIARALPRAEFRGVLPDLAEDDIVSSPFAVQAYTVHADFGGNEGLGRLRARLRNLGVRLMLDFVCNHTALDHAWASTHPEYYVQGTETDLAQWPANWCRLETKQGSRILAHGRDPYFPGWTDTLQLNYRHPGLREAMTDQLLTIASLCDGVRCDMAMLILPDVFQRTWRDKSVPADGSAPVDRSFWPEAQARVRRRWVDFVFMAEVYWDLEWALQQEGFDYTYDKRLYDCLRAQDAQAVHDRLWADPDYQRKSVRFLENHDEHRAAAVWPPAVHRAAAVLTYLVPGLRFFFDGQLEGRHIRVPVQLRRRPAEPVDPAVQDFYPALLEVLRRPTVRDGRWQLLECLPAWGENGTWRQFLAFTWEDRVPSRPRPPARPEPVADPAPRLPVGRRLLGAVNYGAARGQCYVRLPLPELRGRRFLLRDLMGPAQYERDGDELAQKGLYLDVSEWAYHVFEMVAR